MNEKPKVYVFGGGTTEVIRPHFAVSAVLTERTGGTAMAVEQPTCATCPWWTEMASSGTGHCHHESANSTVCPERIGSWWCSAHPERAQRACSECRGAGWYVDFDTPTNEFKDCTRCSGTGQVIPWKT